MTTIKPRINRRLLKKTICEICNYQGKGKGLSAIMQDIFNHKNKEHPELRKFKL